MLDFRDQDCIDKSTAEEQTFEISLMSYNMQI